MQIRRLANYYWKCRYLYIFFILLFFRPSYILAQDRSGSFGARGGGSGLTGDYDIAVDGDLLLAGIAAAGAIFFYLIYNAITAGKRKKRSVRGSKGKAPRFLFSFFSLCTKYKYFYHCIIIKSQMIRLYYRGLYHNIIIHKCTNFYYKQITYAPLICKSRANVQIYEYTYLLFFQLFLFLKKHFEMFHLIKSSRYTKFASQL